MFMTSVVCEDVCFGECNAISCQNYVLCCVDLDVTGRKRFVQKSEEGLISDVCMLLNRCRSCVVQGCSAEIESSLTRTVTKPMDRKCAVTVIWSVSR